MQIKRLLLLIALYNTSSLVARYQPQPNKKTYARLMPLIWASESPRKVDLLLKRGDLSEDEIAQVYHQAHSTLCKRIQRANLLQELPPSATPLDFFKAVTTLGMTFTGFFGLLGSQVVYLSGLVADPLAFLLYPIASGTLFAAGLLSWRSAGKKAKLRKQYKKLAHAQKIVTILDAYYAPQQLLTYQAEEAYE